MRKIKIAMVGAILFILGGCVSIDGYRIVEQDGKVSKHRVGGFPIVVQRPKQAVFVVTRTTYAVSKVAIDASGTPSIVPQKDEIEVSISDKPLLIGPSELYTVDFKRPAAGTIDYSMELSNYYPTKIGGKLDDQTIDKLRQTALDLIEKFTPVPTDVTKESGAGITRNQKAVSLSLLIFDLETGEVTVRDI